MFVRTVLLAAACSLVAARLWAQGAVPPAEDPVPAELELFNGQNLDGLLVYVGDPAIDAAEVCHVEDGMLRVSGVGRGYIRTVHAYADYELHVEWRWPAAGGNSGVMLHVVNPDMLWPKGFEAQLAAGRAGDFYSFVDARSKEERVSRNPTGFSTGRLPRPNLAKLEKPLGEWNSYDIRAVGDELTLSVNGVEVNRMTRVTPSAGMIALQAEGTPIDFRNIRIKLLPPAKDLHAPMPAP